MGECESDFLAHRRKLIEQRNGIAHPTCRLACDLNQRIIIRLDFFSFDNELELLDDLIYRQAAELVTPAQRVFEAWADPRVKAAYLGE